jgi:hypothetical protein
VCFALLQGTENTDIQITDDTEMEFWDYGSTVGIAVKCGAKYALLAKCILQLYFTGDYR